MNKKKKKKKEAVKKEAVGKKKKIEHSEHYEVKLFLISAYTLFSLLALKEDMGIVGSFIKNIYLGLLSHLGIILPFVIFSMIFVKINNKYAARRKQILLGIVLLYIGMNFIAIILHIDVINAYFETPGQIIKNSYIDGIELIGNGIIGNIFGYYSIKLFNKTGLIIVTMPLFILSFTMITGVNIFKSAKKTASYHKKVSTEKKKIKTEAVKKKEARQKELNELKEQRKQELEIKERKKDELREKKFQQKIDKYNTKYNHSDLDDFIIEKSPTKSFINMLNNKNKKKSTYTSIELFDENENQDININDTITTPEYSDFPITDFNDHSEDKLDNHDIIINDEDGLENVLNNLSEPEEFDLEKKTPLTKEEKENVSKFDSMVKKSKENSKKYSDKPVSKPDYDHYKLPSFTLLNDNESSISINQNELYEKAKKLENILENFNVNAKVIGINKGPSITRYEIKLEPGVKLSKITNLSDDIALNLAAEQVRIAAVPNKPVVGIEIPNDTKSIVTLKEVIDNKEFKNNKAKLIAGLGKSIAGNNVLIDLSNMPHLLIAGATGSGKSVCVNTLIVSILMHTKPDEVKFLMVDPKVVELNIYNGIPHLILPVVTDPKKANIALEWAVREMDRRYDEFSANNVKEINGFNQKFKEDKEKYMPHIVVIIDELADLMMVAPGQVEDSICRLTQKARASGIHLIVATQRPSVDVITGVIKANIPSRIAFSVSSSVDSRTILDMSGAEKLLGKGDMLYSPAGSIKPRRVQGAFISEKEVEKIVHNIKYQCDTCVYNEEILERVSNPAKFDEEDEDEYLEDAMKLLISTNQGSISFLQRKFKIGYNRAARLMDMLEEKGVVGPSQGSKPREVLMTMEDIDKSNEENK